MRPTQGDKVLFKAYDFDSNEIIEASGVVLGAPYYAIGSTVVEVYSQAFRRCFTPELYHIEIVDRPAWATEVPQ